VSKRLGLILAALLLAGMVTVTSRAQVGKSTSGLIDPNVAPEKDLLALPHMNETIAKALVEKRPFMNIVELNAFLTSQGLSKQQLTELYGKGFIHINLNKASKDEIMLIPGMGAKMLHEFEEYRPYKSLAVFRKEIGKYVDDKELARLEQYVFVPINLNTASDDDIRSIPGIGPKMLHEFKEYRPYRSIEQFRKEIGKYVSEKEVARLERYVTVE
jgi:DNA uptake protein ComE-like DNA-binding protein